jgi:hypothetical protein
MAEIRPFRIDAEGISRDVGVSVNIGVKKLPTLVKALDAALGKALALGWINEDDRYHYEETEG